MYSVSTWFDELTAVALAANVHAACHPRSPINELFVEEIVNINEWR